MKTVKGDLIQLALAGEFDVIIHGCNCFCTMGAGIAKGIKFNFPEAYAKDLNTESGDENKLGTISFAEVKVSTGKLIVVNAYTQYHYAGADRLVNYDAVRSAFREVKQKFSDLRIGYPAIGTGLAGGDWNIIATIIDEELDGEQHTFVEYQL
ncbi:phosphatase [Prolixibacteraceae bacterium JC049]|nr:phosphatase [Prolixibacteraceae bacterium JC049]